MTKLWFACEAPERPPDPYVRWHFDCRPCRVKAIALKLAYPDDLTVHWLVELLRAEPQP